jgi:predicted regulator of Ras-like GTPase activity (Roadblock/LC7/MglB family)
VRPLSTVVDDPANDVGSQASIAIGADGLPIISHTDRSVMGLRVSHCLNPDCIYSINTTVDDQAYGVGFESSIAIGADGLPIISHSSSNGLRVTHCSHPWCTAGNLSVTIDGVGGRYSSIAIGADGLPVISHQDPSAGALRVTHCGNVSCTLAVTSVTVDDPLNHVGSHSSIAIGTDGLPVIGHYDQTAAALRVTHCGDVACTAGNVTTVVDDAPLPVGLYTSLAIGTDGLPIISHAAAEGLRVTKCGNVACTTGNVSRTMDYTVSIGIGSAMAVGVDGLPVIAHQDGSTRALRVTKCLSAEC